MKKYSSRRYTSRRKKSYAKIGRKTIRRTRRRRAFNKAMPSLKYGVLVPVRRRFNLAFQDPAATFTVGI